MPTVPVNPRMSEPAWNLENPERSYDGLIPRGPLGECFIRPVSNGTVHYELPQTPMGITFPVEHVTDQLIRGSLLKLPSLPTCISSHVRVFGEYVGNGCFVAPNLVITCRHLFTEKNTFVNIIHNGTTMVAKVIHIPEEFIDSEARQNLGDYNFGREYLDICFLLLDHPVLPSDCCLTIPANLNLERYNTICSYGYPGFPPGTVDYKSCFSQRFVDLNSDKGPGFYENFYSDRFFDFRKPVTCFGTYLEDPVSILDHNLLRSDLSVCFGLSGSPVIGLSNQSELIVLVQGGYSGGGENYFVNVCIKSVQRTIEKILSVNK